MKQIVPEIYVMNCGEALDFYRGVFGGDIRNLQTSDNNALFRHAPGKVVHAELHVNNKCIFYFSDIFNEKRGKLGNVSLMLHMETEEEIGRVYAALSNRGHIGMELRETMTGALHAIVTDRYGAPWSLNYSKQ
ncbi:MAG: VOC family protein [Oscillospiraceae bacterium]|nr:VOC family protein [Oscillospiraceae bacterium]